MANNNTEKRRLWADLMLKRQIECTYKHVKAAYVMPPKAHVKAAYVIPPRSKDFFFTSCGSLIPFTRANAQWVIHGSSST